MEKRFGYDENGNRIFSKFTGLPIQPLSYHLMMIVCSIIFVGLILGSISLLIKLKII